MFAKKFYCMRVEEQPGKGQIMSKANCLDLDSSIKRTKYLLNSDLATRAEVLGLFFGRIDDE